MDLSKVFSPIANKFGKQEEVIERFLAIKISHTSVFATVWAVREGKVEIGKVGSEKILTDSFDGLLKAVDKAVSDASVEFPETSKAIFAVPLEAVTNGKINQEELGSLRRLCKELDFSPLGYVVVSEALEQYFKETEGAPLSAILVGLDGKKISVTLYKAGKEIGALNLERVEGATLSIAAEIEKGLRQFQIDALPSRIILYDGDSDLSGLANEITGYPWTGRLPFLHFPKVETVSSEFVVNAVAAAGGVQMGGELPPIEGAGIPTPIEIPVQQEVITTPVENSPQEEMAQEVAPEFVEVSPEEAGFTAAPTENITVEATPIEELKQDATYTESKKFAIGEVVSGLLAKFSMLPKMMPHFSKTQNNTVALEEKQLTGPKKGFPKILLALFAVVILVVAASAAVIYFVPKVKVIASVDSQEFNKEMTLGVTTDGVSNAEEEIVAGNFITTTEIGTKRSVATGQKLVGKKATGNVTIYSVSTEKTFPDGTVLTSPAGLKFTLTREVSVASGDAASAATITAPIEASTIGDSFNLAADTRFSIGSFSASDYLAKNGSAFSGGESHMATVVTKADQDRLMASLSAELSEKALVSLQGKIGEDQTLLPNAVTSAVSKKKFSKDVDNEADTVSLDLTMDFKGIVFSTDEAISLFENKFNDTIPDGYTLVKDGANVTVVEAKEDDDGNTELTMRLDSSVIPKTNADQIATKILGKSQSEATRLISKTTGVTNVKYEISPSLFAPIVNLILPLKKENISVEIIKE